MPAASLAMAGSGVVSRGFQPDIDLKGILSFDFEAVQPHLSVFNAVFVEFQQYACTSAAASSQVYREAKRLLKLEAKWRQLAAEGARECCQGCGKRTVPCRVAPQLSSTKEVITESAYVDNLSQFMNNIQLMVTRPCLLCAYGTHQDMRVCSTGLRPLVRAAHVPTLTHLPDSVSACAQPATHCALWQPGWCKPAAQSGQSSRSPKQSQQRQQQQPSSRAGALTRAASS